MAAAQVCILIDPNMTMADANSVAGGVADSAAPLPEVDTKKLVQVRAGCCSADSIDWLMDCRSLRMPQECHAGANSQSCSAVENCAMHEVRQLQLPSRKPACACLFITICQQH
jgi:hypothetical protein